MNIKETLQNYKRVLAIAHKPDKDEFNFSLRICALGMLILGVMGFVVYLVAVLMGG